MPLLLRIGLENAVAASLMALAALVVSKVFPRSPALIHACLLLVLLKLVTPPIWSVPILQRSAEEMTVATETPTEFVDFSVVEPESFDAVEVDSVVAEEFVEVIETERADFEVVNLPAFVEEPTSVSFSIDPAKAAAAVWLAGSLVTLTVSIGAIRRFLKVLRLAKPASASIQDSVEEAAARIGLARAPDTFLIEWDRPPMVWSMGRRPCLMIPSALWFRLDAVQRDTLLIHELAHLKRGDHLVRWLELTVSVLFWWLPAAWWARRALREAEEDCCDAWVVWALPRSTRSYADTLVETVDFLSEARTKAPTLATGFGHVRHLKRRLTMIMQGGTTRRLNLPGGLAVLALSAALLPWNASLAEPPVPAGEPKAETIVTTDDSGNPVSVTTTTITTTEADDDKKITETLTIAAPAAPAPVPIVAPIAPVPPLPTLNVAPAAPLAPAAPAPPETAKEAEGAQEVTTVVEFTDAKTGQTVKKEAPAGDVIGRAITELKETLEQLSSTPEKKDQNLAQIQGIQRAINNLDEVVRREHKNLTVTLKPRPTVRRQGTKSNASVNSAKGQQGGGNVHVITEDIRGLQDSDDTRVIQQEIRELRQKMQKVRRLARNGDDPTLRSLEDRLNELTTRLGGIYVSQIFPDQSIPTSKTSPILKQIAEVKKRLNNARLAGGSDDDPAILNLNQRLDELTSELGKAHAMSATTYYGDIQVTRGPAEVAKSSSDTTSAPSDRLKQQEKRLSAMERTLEKVLDELKSLKSDKSN